MQFGEKLKEIRNEHKITQEKFANDINVSIQSINKWENHKSYPDLFNLINISEYYGISIDDLLSHEIKKECSNKEKNKVLCKFLSFKSQIFKKV